MPNILNNMAIGINGDIPSVRKICILLNNDYKKPFKLQPVISQMVQKELKKKHLYKSSKKYTCTFRYGKFTLDFR